MSRAPCPPAGPDDYVMEGRWIVCRLSIIVPYLDENQPFEDTLVSVLENRPAECEVMVVHRGGYADPYQLSDEVRFVQTDAGAGQLHLLNAGLQQAVGHIVHLLQPGMMVCQGWADAAMAHFQDPRVAAVSPLVLDVVERERVVSAGLRVTRGGCRIVHGAGGSRRQAEQLVRQPILAPTWQAGFFLQTPLTALGGFYTQVDAEWADADLGLALKALGFRCELEIASVIHSATVARPSASAFESGRSAERVFWRYRREMGGWVSLLAHAGHVVGSTVSQLHRRETYAVLAGRLTAAREWSRYRSHRKRLRRLANGYPDCGGNRSGPDDEEDSSAARAPKGRKRAAA